MTTIIPEFAREMTESNRRASALIDEEIQRVESMYERVQKLRASYAALQEQADKVDGLNAVLENLRRRVARMARAAGRDIFAKSQEVTDLWSSALSGLRGVSIEEQIAILEGFSELAKSENEALAVVHDLWAMVERLGGEKEGAAELAEAGRSFNRVLSETARALEARTTPWRPRDPERLEQGLQEVRDGKAVTPDDAQARFRKKPA